MGLVSLSQNVSEDLLQSRLRDNSFISTNSCGLKGTVSVHVIRFSWWLLVVQVLLSFFWGIFTPCSECAL